MKKIPYNVIQKGKKVTKKLFKVIKHFRFVSKNLFEMFKILNNFFGYFFPFFHNDIRYIFCGNKHLEKHWGKDMTKVTVCNDSGPVW